MKKLLMILVGIAIPSMAFAVDQTIWDFRNNQLPGTWAISGNDMPEGTAEGLVINTTADWSIVAKTPLTHPTEVVSFLFVNAQPTEARLLWHVRGSPEGTYVQLPFIIPQSPSPSGVEVNVDAYPQWDRHLDQVGLALPPGASVLLQEMRFTHWTPLENAVEALKSFWRFDALGPYSINFIWGPVITFNPVATYQLFTSLPPRGRSGNWMFYGVMVIVAAGLFAHRRLKGTTVAGMRHLAAFLLCFGILWAVYDLRMGAEFLTYASTDYSTFVRKPVGERQFRTYANFPDVADLTNEILQPGESFAFYSPKNTPFIAMMRYFTYPNLPQEPEGESDLRTWVIFDRSDVSVGKDERLTLNGKPVSRPGRIVKKIDDFSFIFQTLN